MKTSSRLPERPCHPLSPSFFWGARERSPSKGTTSTRLCAVPGVKPAIFVALSMLAAACDPAPSKGSVPSKDSAPPPAKTSVPAARPTGPLIEWAPAPEGDPAVIAKAELERAKKDGRALFVYVGASWCEPCQRFHDAAQAGEIKGDLPPIRMLEFDLDRDAERLAAAGYGSRLIPLFAVPGPDGRGSDLRIEGSIKGAGAVANIVPRLRALLAQTKGS